MYLIIGSGPAAISCAKGLLSRGVSNIVIVDQGNTLEDDKAELIKRFKNKSYEQWNQEDIQKLKSGVKTDARGIPKKLIYGSDYSYRDPFHFLNKEEKDVEITSSFAKGGLSTVWGANLLPFSRSDISKWPIQYEEMAKSYEKVLEYVPMSVISNEETKTIDHLTKDFPYFKKSVTYLKRSTQAGHLYQKMRINENKLKKDGLIYGHSRLAIKNDEQDCERCTFCMYGCPKELIYSSSSTLDQLIKTNDVEYRPHHLITELSSDGNDIIVKGKNTFENQEFELKPERVFLATGPLTNNKLIKKLDKKEEISYQMLDSQYFLAPFFSFKGFSNPEIERDHALSQIYMELKDETLSDYNIHLQFYSYNDFYPRALQTVFGPLYPLFAFPLKFFLNRMYLVQGYLHSNDSHGVTCRVNKDDSLYIEKIPDKRVNPLVKKVLYRLLKHAFSLGGFIVPMAAKIFPPGESKHIGGQFPMAKDPKDLETDRWGRFNKYSNLHIVDSSIFPSIPGTTITLSIMANAFRIGADNSYEQ